MARRPNHLLRNLLYASLITLAAMHPQAVSRLTQLGTELVLAVITGIAQAATAHPGPAILAAGAVYIAHQARTHRPTHTRAHT